MKRSVSVLLVLIMLLCFAACGSGEAPEATTAQTIPATNAGNTVPEQTQPEGPALTYFSLSWSKEDGSFVSLTAYPEEDGSAHLEYMGSIRKVAKLDGALLPQLVNTFQSTALPELNGSSGYSEDSVQSVSMYVTFADDSVCVADFTGSIPQNFLDGYAVMDQWFAKILTDIPEYIPQPLVNGEVDADRLAALLEIMNSSGIGFLDGYAISDIPMDDSFGFVAGLQSDDGITGGSSCDAMIQPNAFSLVIVTVQEKNQIKFVREDFAKKLNWNKWVCVSADHALVAQKDNMVLCFMGVGDSFSGIKAAITAAGWEDIQQLDRS